MPSTVPSSPGSCAATMFKLPPSAWSVLRAMVSSLSLPLCTASDPLCTRLTVNSARPSGHWCSLDLHDSRDHHHWRVRVTTPSSSPTSRTSTSTRSLRPSSPAATRFFVTKLCLDTSRWMRHLCVAHTDILLELDIAVLIIDQFDFLSAIIWSLLYLMMDPLPFSHTRTSPSRDM
jgi:hypothetical protein